MILRERNIKREVHTTAGMRRLGRVDELAFDSLGDLLKHKHKHPTYGGGYSWIGARNNDELKQKVNDGWTEMEDRMNKMLEEINPPPAEIRPELNRRRRRKKSDFGNSVDIHQIWQGRLDRAWDTTFIEEVETRGNKLVHICVNMSAAAGVDFEAGLWRGAAVMRIFDVLNRLGKSVAISGYYAGHGSLGRVTGMTSCRLKEYGEPLRTDRLAAMVTLGFMRVCLMMLGLDQHPTLTPTPGRGYPIDDYNLLTYAAEEDKEHGGAVVAIGQCFTRDQAQKVVDKFIRQYIKSDEQIEGLSEYELTKTFKSQEVPHHE